MFPKSRYVTPLTEAKRHAQALQKRIRQVQRLIKAQEKVQHLTIKLVEMESQAQGRNGR